MCKAPLYNSILLKTIVYAHMKGLQAKKKLLNLVLLFLFPLQFIYQHKSINSTCRGWVEVSRRVSPSIFDPHVVDLILAKGVGVLGRF